MGDEEEFAALTGNRVDGRPYVALDGTERHYRLHAQLADVAFPRRPFEEVAAVTELFHCATEDATEQPRVGSPCADRYLARVIATVRPRVILAVGKAAEKHLWPRFGARGGPFRVVIAGVNALVVPVPLPNAREELRPLDAPCPMPLDTPHDRRDRDRSFRAKPLRRRGRSARSRARLDRDPASQAGGAPQPS